MNPILLTVWAILAACFGALLLYRGQLTRYEEEQLFLNDEVHQNERVQRAIVRKVKLLGPAVRVLGGAAGICTACVIGIYVWNAWKSIH
jgi:hypothetical protein